MSNTRQQRSPIPRARKTASARPRPKPTPKEREPRGAAMAAVETLRSMLIDGTLGSGEQIRQDEMAEMLSVSRVPLREALTVLAGEGLLQHRLNAGYFVPKRTPSEVRQLWRMLTLLEDELLLTMSWPDAPLISELEQLNEEMRDAVEAEDWSRLLRLNRDFHFCMFGLSSERLILAGVQRLWTLASSVTALKVSHADAAVRTVIEHEAIIDALKKRDREQCIARMVAHRVSTHSKGPTLAEPVS